MLLRYGVGRAPLWVDVLLAAEKWGTPPWMIAPGRSPTIWFIRWQAFESERNRANKGLQEEANRKAEQKWQTR